MPKPLLFETLVGEWTGTCKTWFEPENLADESQIFGAIRPLLNGQFLRHTYRGSMQGKPREGEETLGFNSVEQLYQSAWIDSFHMNYAILISAGSASERGFEVQGLYDVAPGEPRWGWRTTSLLKVSNSSIFFGSRSFG
jgi:hypothetical protein